VIEVPDHVYVLGETYTRHTDLSAKKIITDTHNVTHTNTCDMYKTYTGSGTSITRYKLYL